MEEQISLEATKKIIWKMEIILTTFQGGSGRLSRLEETDFVNNFATKICSQTFVNCDKDQDRRNMETTKYFSSFVICLFDILFGII